MNGKRPTLGDYEQQASGNGGKGLRCPQCNCADLRAQRRLVVAGGYNRVRICRNCGQRVMTGEQVKQSLDAAKQYRKPPPDIDCANNRMKSILDELEGF